MRVQDLGLDPVPWTPNEMVVNAMAVTEVLGPSVVRR
jgi:hypothetical protein